MVNPDVKEEIILKAAMDVFIEKGRHGARMQEIADRAGINKALLHYYFRNKENLYSQIFERVFGNFIINFTLKLDPAMDIREALQGFIHDFTGVLKHNEKIPLFMARELSEGGETVAKIISRFNSEDSGPQKLIRFFDEAKQRGQIRPNIDSVQLLLTLLGSCVYFFLAEPLIKVVLSWPENFTRDQFVEDRKEAIFDVLYNGIKP
jgi:TetR/AcrR family transcriptional regulator